METYEITWQFNRWYLPTIEVEKGDSFKITFADLKPPAPEKKDTIILFPPDITENLYYIIDNDNDWVCTVKTKSSFLSKELDDFKQVLNLANQNLNIPIGENPPTVFTSDPRIVCPFTAIYNYKTILRNRVADNNNRVLLSYNPLGSNDDPSYIYGGTNSVCKIEITY